jgi:hypothetical protein
VLRLLNVEHVAWVSGLSWAMVVFACTSQVCVWSAILTGRFRYYFYEESGWLLIFIANTIASAYLYTTTAAPGDHRTLLLISLAFGAIYLPWQYIHLGVLRADVKAGVPRFAGGLAYGLRRSIELKRRRTDAESWGGIVGLIWMAAYWAMVIPAWLYYIVAVFADSR